MPTQVSDYQKVASRPHLLHLEAAGKRPAARSPPQLRGPFSVHCMAAACGRRRAGRAPLRGRDAVRAPAAGGRPPALRSGEAAAVKEAPLPLRLLPPPTGCRKRVNGERVVGGGKGGQGARSQSGAASGGRWRRWRGVGSEVVQGSRRRRLRGSKGKLKLQSGLLVRGPRSPHPGRWTSTESSKR